SVARAVDAAGSHPDVAAEVREEAFALEGGALELGFAPQRVADRVVTRAHGLRAFHAEETRQFARTQRRLQVPTVALRETTFRAPRLVVICFRRPTALLAGRVTSAAGAVCGDQTPRSTPSDTGPPLSRLPPASSNPRLTTRRR